MKKFFLAFFLISLAFLPLGAQETYSQEEFLRRYNNLTGRVGPAGLGVETLLDRWEAAFPEDTNQMLARFSFYFTRSQTSKVEQMAVDRYLGNDPILPMTDSLGNKANWFEVFYYDDDLFAQAKLAIDRAIAARPERLDYRFAKTNALLAYEKESPDMTLQDLKALSDLNFKTHPAWEYEGLESVNDEQFKAFMQEYCVTFFRLGTPGGADAFLALSEHLLGYCKDEPIFVNNQGSYWLLKKDFKKARKYFDQVLKKDPGDMTALTNCLLMARTAKDVKLEKKYLAQMAGHGATELDRNSAKVRLDALSGKK